MNNNGFKSNIGFILAAIGSAVGLGNIWSFPYKLARGGVLFLCFYCFLALFVGVPLLVGEMYIGSRGGGGVVSAYKKISPKLKFVGVLSVISPCIVMSYYVVIGGLCIRYFLINLKRLFFGFSFADNNLRFENIVSDILGGVVYALIFVIITYFISKKGVSSGIERFNKIAVPLLFGILLFTMFRTLSRYGASEWLEHLAVYDEKYAFSDVLKAFSSAGEQMFFSLSVAVGTMVTYGSLMDKRQNIHKSALVIAGADSIAALMAGLTVIPAAFSLNISGASLSGPGLLFVTMQSLFDSDSRSGALFGTLFFLLVIVAALSSAVAFIEVPVSAITDMGAKNRHAVLAFCCMIVSVPAVLIAADGFKNGIMEIWIFIAEGLIIPVTALVFALYIGWFGGRDKILKEIAGSKFPALSYKIFSFIFKFFAPFVLGTVIIGQIIDFCSNT